MPGAPPTVWEPLIVTLGGSLFLLYQGREARRARASRSWPTVEALITDSRVERQTDSRGNVKTALVIKYCYQVDGVEYVGKRVAFGGLSLGALGLKAEDYRDEYTPGSRTPVHVSPQDPNLSVLKPGLTTTGFALMVLAVGWTAFSLMWLLAWLW